MTELYQGKYYKTYERRAGTIDHIYGILRADYSVPQEPGDRKYDLKSLKATNAEALRLDEQYALRLAGPQLLAALEAVEKFWVADSQSPLPLNHAPLISDLVRDAIAAAKP